MFEELQSIVGPDRVTRDPGELYCYSFDSSYVRGRADYVVRPKSAEEIAEIVKVASKHNVPIVPRGSASGLTGGSVPVKGGIVLDMTGMNRILELEVENLQVVIEPGIIHKDLNIELMKHGFFFPPDPGSSDMCTVGGLIANGGSGMHSVKYGTVKDYVLGLEVVLPGGDIINTGCKALKTSSGYDLTRLFIGSEGTLGIITKARLKIYPLPETKSVLMATFGRVEDAGKAAVAVLSSGVIPAAMEIMDRSAIKAVKEIDQTLDVPDVEALLLFEVDGYRESVVRQVDLICGACGLCGGRTQVAKLERLPYKVTYHDPCHLGRCMGVYGEPRAIIERICEFEEMATSKRDARCCGGGGGVRRGYGDLARKIAKKRLSEAPGDVDYIVTACPMCHANLQDAGGKMLDISELVLMSLI